jgi:type I restriction enzyme S subunit
LKFLFQIVKDISGELGHDVLSVTQRGIKKKDLTTNEGQMSMDYSKYQFVRPGQFVMNHMDLLTGYVDVSNYDGVTSPDYRVFEVSNDSVSPRYYLSIFQMCYHTRIFYGLGSGVSTMGRWRLPSDEFLNFPLPYPPLTEQHQIVSFLDEKTSLIDDLIKKKEQKIGLLKEYRTSLINRVITKGLNPDCPMKDSGVEWIGEIPSHWDVKPLKRLVSENQSSLGSDTPDDYELDYVEISDLDSSGRISNTTHYLFSDSPSRCRRVLSKGDVFISSVRTYLRAIGIVEDDVENLICSTGFSVLTPKEFVISKYLFYSLRTEWFISDVVSQSEGVSYPSIQSEKLLSIHIVLPPLSEQEQIVSFLDDKTGEIDRTIQSEKKKIELLKEYRQSLISSVITGKIKVVN